MAGDKIEVLKNIAEASGRKGLKTELKDNTLIVSHPEYPLMLVITGNDSSFTVEIKVGEGLEENIEELLGDEIDPRAELEDALDQLLGIADYAVRKLELAGFKVKRRTREGVLDLYDALESFLE